MNDTPEVANVVSGTPSAELKVITTSKLLGVVIGVMFFSAV